jgi:hypothetical protein
VHRSSTLSKCSMSGSNSHNGLARHLIALYRSGWAKILASCKTPARHLSPLRCQIHHPNWQEGLIRELLSAVESQTYAKELGKQFTI